MIRCMKLDLAYGLKKEQRLDPNTGKFTTDRELSRVLIVTAFQQNYSQGMDAATSRFYRNIGTSLDKACEDEMDYIEISAADLDKIREEVFKTKYLPMHAFIAPLLFDELDAIKNRDITVDAKLREEHLYPTVGYASKTQKPVKIAGPPPLPELPPAKTAPPAPSATPTPEQVQPRIIGGVKVEPDDSAHDLASKFLDAREPSPPAPPTLNDIPDVVPVGPMKVPQI